MNAAEVPECAAFSSPEESVLINVLAGMTSGAVAAAIANPTDVLKVNILM